MAEENQVMKEPQQATKEPQRVTTKDPKKVEVGTRLAAINHKKREVKKREEQVQLEKTTSRVNQYYGIRAVIALGVIGGLGYYNYRTKKGEVPNNPPQQPCPQVQLQTPWSGAPAGSKNGQEEYSK